MVSNNKKKRKNNRNNNKNKIEKANNELLHTSGQKEENSVNEEETESEHGNVDAKLENESNKRPCIENDSDFEDEPQRKKKKKQPLPSETSDKKGKKSIRQMKREKHAQRQAEAQVASKDHLKSQCLSYLSQWKHNRQNWKFMKAKQVWIYKNKFSTQLLPDASWPIFLEYFESAKGNIRNMLLEDANKIIKQMDEWTESHNQKEQTNEDNDSSDQPESQKPDETVYKRARDLIQCLQE